MWGNQILERQEVEIRSELEVEIRSEIRDDLRLVLSMKRLFANNGGQQTVFGRNSI